MMKKGIKNILVAGLMGLLMVAITGCGISPQVKNLEKEMNVIVEESGDFFEDGDNFEKETDSLDNLGSGIAASMICRDHSTKPYLVYANVEAQDDEKYVITHACQWDKEKTDNKLELMQSISSYSGEKMVYSVYHVSLDKREFIASKRIEAKKETINVWELIDNNVKKLNDDQGRELLANSSIEKELLVRVISEEGYYVVKSGSFLETEEETPSENREDLKDSEKVALKSYKKVLENKKTAIEYYETKYDGKNYDDRFFGVEDGGVAIADINGDNVPELLYFDPTESVSAALLHIYTYSSKLQRAVEINYPLCGNPFDDEAGFKDVNAASGTSYIIYKGKKPNTLYIYSKIGDASMWYNIDKLKVGKDEKVTKEWNFVKTMHFALPDRKESQEYHLKGQEIDASKGNALIKDSCDDMDLILLKKEYRDENDESIWKCAEKVKNVQMTVEEALKYIEERI